MRIFEYAFPAVRGIQAGHEYFAAMCPLTLASKLLDYRTLEVDLALPTQTTTNESRVKDIAAYIEENGKTYVLPPLIVIVDGDVHFEAASATQSGPDSGFVHLSVSTRLAVVDGVQRCRAIEAALRGRPDLGRETVSMMILVDPGFKRARQILADVKRHESIAARPLSLLYDTRDEISEIVRRLIQRVAVFVDMIELTKSSISNRSFKLFTFSAIYHATARLLSGQKDEPFERKLVIAVDFWEEVSRNMPDWQRAKERKVSPAQLRRDYIHSHALALAALARVGSDLLKGDSRSWRRRLKGIKTIDWRRDNAKLWEGRATIAGRLSKTRICVVLTGNAVKQHLDMPLTAAEGEAEERLQQRV